MSGALLLGIISLVCVTDLMIAYYFLRMANRADGLVGAAPGTNGTNPEAARRFARVLFMATPGMWLVVALLSFGIVPVGNITPITF